MFRKVILVISVSLFFAFPICAQDTAPASTSSTTSIANRPPIFRPTKDQIMQVQTILNNKKFYTGEANGKYNDDTHAGIKVFQKDNGLKSTGGLNRATLEKFGVELTNNQKLIPVSQNSFAIPASDETKPKTVKKPTIAATAAASSPDADKPKRSAPFRAMPDQIKAAQKLLKEKSMYTGGETGKLDPATREALQKFKEANGMKVTDTLNAETLKKMGIELTDKQKAYAAAAAKN